MTRSMALLLTLVFLCGVAFAQSGWTDLFPDAKFTGWTRLPIPPTGKLTDVPQWKVDTARRLIVCEGNGGHDWMRCDREFSNFLLHVEWRFTKKAEGEQKYNSGIFVRNSADASIWHQAQTGGATGGWLFGDTLVNGVKQRVNLRSQAKSGLEKPAGEWNTFDIRCDGRTIALTVNGSLACEMTNCEVPKGHIGLEAEGYRIEFRNLRIKELR